MLLSGPHQYQGHLKGKQQRESRSGAKRHPPPPLPPSPPGDALAAAVDAPVFRPQAFPEPPRGEEDACAWSDLAEDQWLGGKAASARADPQWQLQEQQQGLWGAWPPPPVYWSEPESSASEHAWSTLMLDVPAAGRAWQRPRPPTRSGSSQEPYQFYHDWLG